MEDTQQATITSNGFVYPKLHAAKIEEEEDDEKGENRRELNREVSQQQRNTLFLLFLSRIPMQVGCITISVITSYFIRAVIFPFRAGVILDSSLSPPFRTLQLQWDVVGNLVSMHKLLH